VLNHLKKDEIVGLACDLIRQPSLTNKEGPAVDYMIDWYEDQGFDEVIVQEVQPGGLLRAAGEVFSGPFGVWRFLCSDV